MKQCQALLKNVLMNGRFRVIGETQRDGMMDGQRVREIRNRKGMKQKELAARVGLSPSMVSQIERGERPIPDKRIADFASSLGVTVDELRGEDRPDDNTPTEGRTVRTSADVNRWRDELSRADMDFNLRGLLSVLPAFQDREGDWPFVVLTLDELEEDGNVPGEVIEEHWDAVLESPWVERVKDVECVLRLVFPECE